MTIKINVALTAEQHEGIERYALRHDITVPQLLRDVTCDLAGLDSSTIRPRRSKHSYDPIRMPPLPDQSMTDVAADFARRGFSAGYIAARTKLPWREIDEIIKANPDVKTTKV
jgi:hypothetical protein